MVAIARQSFLALFLVVLFAGHAFAASFSASVDRNEVAVGESFTLDLTLSGASPQGRPDFDPLRENFTVYSQGQSSQTSIINNKMSSSINWRLVLIPLKTGRFTIPAITLETDDGRVQSQPVTINVTKAATSASAASRTVFVQTELSKADPYINEPVILTVKLVARRTIANIRMPEFSIDGAIVEQQGEPRVYEGVMQGQHVGVVEVKFLVTPLQEGTLKIPPFGFQGQIESGRRVTHPGDPFGMMDEMFAGFTGFDAFAVASEESLLKVKPPEVAMDPWLPLTGLELADHIEGLDKATVGQPLTRTLMLAATGTVGSALPSMEKQAAPEVDFKAYADNPKTGDDVGKDGIVTGWREERYTLIPQHDGTLSLPEIRVPWWNVAKGKVEYATAPARTISVKPAPGGSAQVAGKTTRTYPDNAAASDSADQGKADREVIAEVPVGGDGRNVNNVLYMIIAALCAGVIVLTGIVLYLFRRIAGLQQGTRRGGQQPKMVAAANQDRLSAADLKKVETPEGLRGFLQAYACQHWGLARNASLPVIAEALGDRIDPEGRAMLLSLDHALYGGGAVDMARAKALCAVLLKKAGAGARATPAAPRRQGLNPS